MASPPSPIQPKRSRRRTRRVLKKRAWMALFVTLLSGCALYEGGQQHQAQTAPAPPAASLVISAPSQQFGSLVQQCPELAEVLHERGLDPQKAVHAQPQGRVICVVADTAWPEQSRREEEQCRAALASQVDRIEQELPQKGAYPSGLALSCPQGGKAEYQLHGSDFEVTCTGPHHHCHYSSMTGFDAPQAPPAPECALAAQAPEPARPWWLPASWTASSAPPVQLVSGASQLLTVATSLEAVSVGQTHLQLRSSLAGRWLPEELQGALHNVSFVDITLQLPTAQGIARLYGCPGEAGPANVDLNSLLARLPEAPVAMVYDRGFAHSLGLHLEEPVAFDSAASQMLKNLGGGQPGWVGAAAQLDLTSGETRHERGRLCSGRAAAVALLPEPSLKAGPHLLVRDAQGLTQVALGGQPQTGAGNWTSPGPLPGPPGAAGWVSGSLAPFAPGRVRWVAGRDSLGLWLVFDAEAQQPQVAAKMPTQGPDVEKIYKRHPTVIAGR